MSEDDISEYGGMYENGHWEWDEDKNELKFISDSTNKEEIILSKWAAAGSVQFRDDVDIYEQNRYKNRYQRKVKPGKPEVITVQDVKDVVIFSAPMSIMSEKLINMLHRPTTERFIRALILYCQYYIQILNVMSEQHSKLEKQIQTPKSKLLEEEYRENLCDLRILVAKEYCTMAIGGADTRPFHHMGLRKIRSFEDQDAHLYKTFMIMCIQIVWLALGRKAFNPIEQEVYRLFKTERFMGQSIKMPQEQRNVLHGHCLRHDKMFFACSPLVNEIFCHRRIDYRLMSLGVVKHDQLPPRTQFLERALADPEETFETNKIVVGILGLERFRFDAMLNPVSIQNHAQKQHNSTSKPSSDSNFNSTRRKSAVSSSQKKIKQDMPISKNLYPDIIFPPRIMDEGLPASFPATPAVVRRRCNAEQRDRWLNRYSRILNARKSTIC